MSFWAISLCGASVPSPPVKNAPPVPTTNCRMPPRLVHRAVAVQRREALVVVAVTRQQDLRLGVLEGLPERLHEVVAAVVAGAVARVVPVGERAVGRVRRQVRPQPALLLGAGRAGHARAVRVECDQVPCAQVEAVVALAARARGAVGDAGAVEVVEIAGRGAALVVAEDRAGDRLHSAPRGRVDGVDPRRRRAVVLDVAERQDHVGGAATRRSEVASWWQRSAVPAPPL